MALIVTPGVDLAHVTEIDRDDIHHLARFSNEEIADRIAQAVADQNLARTRELLAFQSADRYAIGTVERARWLDRVTDARTRWLQEAHLLAVLGDEQAARAAFRSSRAA